MAFGLSIINGLLNIPNFAHGALYALVVRHTPRLPCENGSSIEGSPSFAGIYGAR
jgi:hypothetical protein